MQVSLALEAQGGLDALQRVEVGKQLPVSPIRAAQTAIRSEDNVHAIPRPLRQLANSPTHVAREPARSLTD